MEKEGKVKKVDDGDDKRRVERKSSEANPPSKSGALK